MTMSLPRRSASQIADELSALKANIDEGVELMYSDDPEDIKRGEHMLAMVVTTEKDLRAGCNRIISSAAQDDVYAGGLNGQIEALQLQVSQLKAQQYRFQTRARRKRVFAADLLDHHFPDENTHPTPFGNLKTIHTKPSLINRKGTPLRPSDLPEDYEYLIKKREKRSVEKYVDEEQLLRDIASGQTFPFCKRKENSTRFF